MTHINILSENNNPEEGKMKLIDTGFKSSLAYEQVTWTPTTIIKEGYDGWGEHYQHTMDPRLWGFALLENEAASKIIIRRFTFLTGEFALDKAQVKAELAVLGVTHIQETSNGFITFTMFDGKDARKFGDLRTLEIQDLTTKMFKRLSFLNVMSYLRACYARESVKIKFVRAIKGVHVDGEVIISPNLVKRVADDLYNRVAPIDEDKAERLYNQAMNASTFNTFRMLIDEGLIKGDAVVGDMMMMEGYDLIVYVEDNLKTEIKLRDADSVIISMLPNKQAKDIRTNRQVISLIGETLYGKDLHLARDHFDQVVGDKLAALKNGQYLPAFRESKFVDAIDGIMDKAHVWHDTFGHLRGSRYLTDMLANGFVKSHTPPVKEDDRKRRYSVPFAKSYSIRSEHSYQMHYGTVCPIKSGEVLLDKNIGLVVADDILEEFLAIAGGGDLDDKANVHARIIDGIMQALIIRDPMSADTDGETIGLEYQIRPITGHGVDHELLTFHGEMPPVFDMEDRPAMVTEIVTPEETLTATDQNFPETYTRHFAWDRVVNNMQDSFGGFVNCLMAYVMLDIPFPFRAKGETLIDICQQTRNPDDLAEIADYVEELRETLVSEIYARDLTIDRHVARRAGIHKMLSRKRQVGGLFTSMIASHKAIIASFADGAAELSNEIRADIIDEHPVPEMDLINGMEAGDWFAMMLRRERQNLERQLGEDFSGSKPMPEWKRTLLGDHLAEYLMAKVDDPNQGLTYDTLLSLVRELFYWAHRREAVNANYPEKELYYGAMFHILIDALNN